MVTKRAWQDYPLTYRSQEIQVLSRWIRAGESGSIIGLPGAGKSNLLGFLSNRPETLERYLPAGFGQLALVHVDLNNLPRIDLATFFRVILRALFEARVRLSHLDESLAITIESLYRKVEDKRDPFLAQSALREALFLFEAQEIRLVFVLDPFDQFCQTAPTAVLDNLRGLRDSFKSTVSYLMALRHEVSYIRNPIELGELYEIVDTHRCWLGSMDRADALWVIEQVETATGQDFGRDFADHLVVLSGGYPALLKAASLWLASVSQPPEPATWLEQLLAKPSLRNRLHELRQSLTGEEEAVLSVVQNALMIEADAEREQVMEQIAEKYQEILARLQEKGLYQASEAGWRLFSPLFAAFILNLDGVRAGRIRRDALSGHFFIGERDLTGLSDRDRQLLQHFLSQPRVAHSITELIEAAWPDDDSRGVSNEAVQQAIRHLRKQIEPNPAKPSYLVTERGAGYRFFPEGAPQS